MSQGPRFRPHLIKVDVSNLWVRLHHYQTGKLKHLRWGAIESIENDWNYNIQLLQEPKSPSFHATFVIMATGNVHPVSEMPETIFQKLQDEIDKFTGTQ